MAAASIMPSKGLPMPPPSVFSIPPGESFVDALVRGLVAEAGDPLALSSTLILLPTRRACRALREAFLRQSGGRPLLLPRMRPMGDADEDELSLSGGLALDLPPAMPSLRRQLLLAQLIISLGKAQGGSVPTAEQAAELAAELADFLDQVHAEGLSFDRLANLVPEEYAEHWQITLDFLKILVEHWPSIVTSQGWMESALRRNRLIEAQAAAWEAEPPDFPIIAAGSTGSMPATARLLSVVAHLPRGRLILPGLDREIDAASRAVLDQTHPQYGLNQLLQKLGLDPADVPLWPHCQISPRAWLVSEALRPARTTEAWRHLDRATAAEDAAKALHGVRRIDSPSPREEAGAIALMMREALEQEDRTAALVTPDRALARRVAAELRRFGIEIDDSAGRPLDLTPPGTFLLLTAAMLAEDFAPHATLAALKHPLAWGGMAAGAFHHRVRKLEIAVLRGPRPAPGIAGLRAALATSKQSEDLAGWLALLEQTAAPIAALMERREAPLSELLRTHVAFAESLAASDDAPGSTRLWAGDAGEAAATFIADLAEAADALPPLSGHGYPGLLRSLMGSVTVRPSWGGHPRLSIWGPLEARMQHTDLLILGGLNEGVWPPDAAADPWMSRPMRDSFGLPQPERRIGLSAHDFTQAFCAPQVVLTRSTRVDGTPTVPSRWLLRLDAVLEACGVAQPWQGGDWLDWHNQMDRPDHFQPGQRPAPRPPLAARPRQLSATAIETWMRDPYAIYAKHILRLKALDPIDADPGAADYGTAVHGALDQFIRAYPRGPLPPRALEILIELGRGNFGDILARPGQWAFWWPRFERIASWFISQEEKHRGDIAESHSEVKGSLEIAAPGGPFTITATADRIDILRDGSLHLIDYKTGAPPTVKEVAAGYAPQLPIEAMIAEHGGFPDISARQVSRLTFWRLRGGNPGGEERPAGDDPHQLAAEALRGLGALIAAFDDEATAYEARPHPDKAPKYSDYLHLARVKEWTSGDGEGEE